MPTAKRIIKNPSGYRSKGANPAEKVNNLALFMKQFGWTGKWWEEPETNDLYLEASREAEKIELYWAHGIPWAQEIYYTYAGYRIKCRNVSAAAKIAQSEPDPDRMRTASRRRRSVPTGASLQGSNGAGSGRNGAGVGPTDPTGADAATDLIASLTSYVPWTKESTPEEIKQELVSYRVPTITWVHRMTHDVKSATIMTKSRHFKVSTNKAGQVIITFADAFGFHSVYATSVIGVS